MSILRKRGFWRSEEMGLKEGLTRGKEDEEKYKREGRRLGGSK